MGGGTPAWLAGASGATKGEAKGEAEGEADGLHTRIGAPMRLEGAAAWRPVGRAPSEGGEAKGDGEAVKEVAGTRCGGLCWWYGWVVAWAGVSGTGLVSSGESAPHCPQATRGLAPPAAVLAAETVRAATLRGGVGRGGGLGSGSDSGEYA